MKTIGVFKIGEGFYRENTDKNSGYYESQLIKRELDALDLNCRCPEKGMTLVIIGGREPSVSDTIILKYALKVADKKIFVLTDLDSIHYNADIIDQCDLVLTQTNRKIEGINKPQRYGYVPELFYDDSINPQPNYKHNGLYFAGTAEGREDNFFNYLLNPVDMSVRERVTLIGKHSNLYDYRIGYQAHLTLQQLFRYTLMIVDEKARDIGWVTSRYVEAINYNVLPLIDECYDLTNHFATHILEWEEVSDMNLIVFGYDTMVKKMEYFDCNPAIRNEIIRRQREMLKNNCKNFIKIVKEFS